MMENSGLLTSLLLAIKQQASLGYIRLISPALSLAQIFISVEVLLLGLWIAHNEVDNMIVAGFKKTLFIGFSLYLITNFEYLSGIWLDSMGQAGILAGGGGIPPNLLHDPSTLLELGFACANDIFTEIGGTWQIITNPLKSLFLGIGGLAIILAYFIISANLLIIMVEFHLMTVCAVILLPFGIFSHTKFISEGVLSGCVRSGVQVMVLAFILCLSFNILQSLRIPEDPTISELLLVSAICGTIAWLSSSTPYRIASALSGSPDLSMRVSGGAVMTGTAGAGAVGVYTGRKAGQQGKKLINQLRKNGK